MSSIEPRPAVGNTTLVDYGIYNEESDLRAHVCPNAGKVYVYPTRKGVESIDPLRHRLVDARQPGINIVTAQGYLVPPSDIWGCLDINARWAMQMAGKITYGLSTSDKGAWAVRVVQLLLSKGWFPFWGTSEAVEDTDIQVQGIDLVITTRARIQVKCDFEGGEPARPGKIGERITGNLFLQVKECNPFRQN